MEIISRSGSIVIIRAKDGKLWLTRRHKIRRTNKRQKPKPRSVRYIPIKEL